MGTTAGRGQLWRSRWAAIGAAVAVTFGAGGLVAVNAAGGVDSTTVLTDPVRVLDSRNPVDVGLAGPFASQVSQKLQITGSIPTTTGTKTVVPSGATGVLLNVTTLGSTANGFISIRPGDATGLPSTSSLNFTAGQVTPNAVLVALPTSGANAGQIDITYDAFGASGPTTDMLIDVVGYTNNSTLAALQAKIDTKANSADVYTKAEIDASVANTTRHAGLIDGGTGLRIGAYASIGNWTSTKTGPGAYRITIPAFGTAGCTNVPVVQTTAHFVGDGIAPSIFVKNVEVLCTNGNALIDVTIRNSAGDPFDATFSFQTVAGARPPLAAGLSEYTVCTFDESGTTCE